MLGLYDSPSANSINGTGKLNDNPNPSFSLSTKIICYAIIQKKKKDGTFYPPYRKRDEKVYLFNGDMCR